VKLGENMLQFGDTSVALKGVRESWQAAKGKPSRWVTRFRADPLAF